MSVLLLWTVFLVLRHLLSQLFVLLLFRFSLLLLLQLLLRTLLLQLAALLLLLPLRLRLLHFIRGAVGPSWKRVRGGRAYRGDSYCSTKCRQGR